METQEELLKIRKIEMKARLAEKEEQLKRAKETDLEFNPKELLEKKVNGITITRFISSGGFGHVYEGTKGGQKVALKIPIKNTKKNGEKCVLDEYQVYTKLNTTDDDDQFVNPNKFSVKLSKSAQLNTKFIVMDLHGESIETKLQKSKKPFEIWTVLSLGIQMINIIRYIHMKGFIHRDLKPDNFVYAQNNEQRIYCIDFGLAKRWTKKTGQHIDYKVFDRFCGTARYASSNAHKGIEQSRRDDLESIGYIMVYLLTKKLPWQKIKHKDRKERNRLIGEMKDSITPEQLCKGLPKQFVTYFQYIRSLEFEEKPLYSALKKLLKDCLD